MKTNTQKTAMADSQARQEPLRCTMNHQGQLDLFSSVLHAYSTNRNGELANQDLYRLAAANAGIDSIELERRDPVGESGQLHNLVKRRIRWYQQTLKLAGILTHVDGERGVWQLTQSAGKDLSQIQNNVAILGFSTDLGLAILGSCDHVFASFDCPITVAITSPPYPLAKARAYGNPPLSAYVDWICKTLENVVKHLVRGGNIALNVSNDVFERGSPARSTYLERMVIALEDRLGLKVVDRLIWRNKSKPPGPVRYASIDRTHLNVGYEFVYLFTNCPQNLLSDNRRVLQEHAERHLQLIAAGGEQRDAIFSDGAYKLRKGAFSNPTEGRIPRNVLEYSHTCPDQRAYKRHARALGLPVHGAPMPLTLAKFLVEFLSEPGSVVADPFFGSGTTGRAAELLGRRWIGTERIAEYLIGSAWRFRDAQGFHQLLAA